MLLSHISNQICYNFNHIKHHIRQPDFMLSHAIFCSMTAITTSICLKTPPKETLIFIHLLYLIDQVVSPIFSSLLEPYRLTTLIPLTGQVSHLLVSTALANRLCFAISRMNFSYRQILAIGVLSLVSKSMTKIVMNRYFKAL